MNKSKVFCGLLCLIFALNGYAETLVVSDTQDANNWGDWFLPEGMPPKSGSPPKYLPYYRWDDNDWGWTHTLTFENPPIEILCVTLEIEAWDVDLPFYEIHKIYGDGIYLGDLVGPPDQPETGNHSGYEAGWHTTILSLNADALQALMDGSMDIWMDIDSTCRMLPGEGSEAVTLSKSTLKVTYTVTASDNPNEPPTDPNIPQDDPNDPVDNPIDQIDIHTFSAVDVSLPTFGDNGDLIGQLGSEQAWFAFDISSIPDEEQVVFAYLSAEMRDFGGITSQRTLWYDSNDSWIVTTSPNLSDPGAVAAEKLVGVVLHNDMDYTPTIINILHDWSDDLNDNYVTLMLSGPADGTYEGGAVDTTSVELTILTVSTIDDINGDGTILNLGPELLVKSGGSNIQVPGYSVPSLTDWNNDGLYDLLIGEGGGFGEGKVRIYFNEGTISEPNFSDFSYAQSFGSDLICPAAGCMGCFPRIVNWDADKCKDLLIGQADGAVVVYLNIGTDNRPVFDGGMFLEVGDASAKKIINVGGRATPTIVDWNNDGRKDLLAGALDGKIHIFINEGTDTEPDFLMSTLAQENGSDLVVPGLRSSPEVLDLDLDGLKDILTGNTYGQLLFYSNVGTNESPLFSGFTFVESDGVPIDLPGEPRSRPFVCYWDADIYPDVLIGAGYGNVHLYLGRPILGLTDIDGGIIE